MEMEDHHQHHNHNHQIHHPYSITDLRHLISATTTATTIPPPAAPSSFEALMMMGGGGGRPEMMPLGLHHMNNPFQHHHHHDGTSSLSGGVEAVDCGGGMAGDGGTGRWPRQETLTLLEIRSRLDSKFKEANQKGPLWDEVSRIMCEEHGYQRSGKKCREKFENLYKYYKKTKEGKAGRQDGKHYRFFRQLEALYGETSNINNNQVITSANYSNNLQFHPSAHNALSQEGFNNNVNNNNNTSLSLSNNNSSDFESSYSSDYDNNNNHIRSRSRGWKAKIKEFIDAQMRKLMEKQEAWLERLMKTLEQKERERNLREEDWRAKEAVRIEREHRFWAKERAWIEARDSALMEALKNLTGKEQLLLNVDHHHHHNDNDDSTELGLNPNNNNTTNVDCDDQEGNDEIHGNDNVGKGDNHHHGWLEPEVSRLIQLRTSMESRFEEGGFLEEVLWEEIAAKMVCLGFDRRSGSMCREKWESINGSISEKSNHLKKKRKDDSRECGDYGHFHHHHNSNNECNSTSLYNYQENCDQINEGTSSSPSNANVGNSSTTHHHHNVVNHDSCFPFLIGEGSTDHLWDNYGLKINKGGQN